MITEPQFEKEKELEISLANAIKTGCHSRGVEAVVLTGFGLDLAVFAQKKGENRTCFFEVKAFADKHGRCGFGNGGSGNQLWLLYDRIGKQPRGATQLDLLDKNVRWILGHRSKSPGSSRFLLFTCAQAQAAASNGVAPGKHNNLRLSDFNEHWITWDTLISRVMDFIDPDTPLAA